MHQVSNACLAVAMAQKFLERQIHIKPEPTLSRAFIEGLEQVRWPGRCQTIQDPKGRTTWFLDGAHTVESLDCCVRWFVSPGVGLPLDTRYVVLFYAYDPDLTAISQRPTRVLLFNITHGRSGPAFLGAMEAAKLAQLKLHERDEDPEMFFKHVIFCTNTTYASGSSKSGACCKSHEIWYLTALGAFRSCCGLHHRRRTTDNPTGAGISMGKFETYIPRISHARRTHHRTCSYRNRCNWAGSRSRRSLRAGDG